MSNKKYGLIVPERAKPVFQASRNVFGNDSDSEEETKKKPFLPRPSDNTTRQKFLRYLTFNNNNLLCNWCINVSHVDGFWVNECPTIDIDSRNQAKITQEKAVLEDPTVYQYDEIYDDIVNKKETVKLKTKEEKKPQYIENLMKAASKRKIESERRLERQIQKEREKEGDEFKDKEVFVTSAYKKKLEEMRLEEEKEKREEYLESIGDVTKQNDLNGFYRHLYEQKLGKSENSKKDEDVTSQKKSEAIEIVQTSTTPSNPCDSQKKRNYRKRKSSDTKPCLSDGEIEESDEEINRLNLDDIRNAKKHKQENIDADSDFSIDESSDEEVEKEGVDFKQPKSKNTEKAEERLGLPNDTKSNSDKNVHDSKDVKDIEVEKPKIDIWKKRTVGPIFEEALRRYYERKAVRSC